MTFPRIRAAGMWTLGSVLAPSEAETFDDHQSKAVDGYSGGAYAPISRLVFGGAGADFTGGTGVDPLGPLTSTAAPGSGASGLVSTGDGGGAGVHATGGGTFGDGIIALTVNGSALLGHASGTGFALDAGADNPTIAAGQIHSNNGMPALILGSATGNALVANGGGTAAGIVSTGGAGGGRGGTFIGGAADGTGLFAIGVGNGEGLAAFSSGTSGALYGTASGGGNAGTFLATGGGDAGSFIATAGNGRGVYGQGFGTGPGGAFQAGATTGLGVDVQVGSLRVSTNTASPSTATGANQIWSGLITKSTGFMVTDGAGGWTNPEGVNFTASIYNSATPAGSQIDVAFTTHMASADYYAGVSVERVSGVGTGYVVNIFNKTAAGFSFLATGILFPTTYSGAGSTASFAPLVNFLGFQFMIGITVVARQ